MRKGNKALFVRHFRSGSNVAAKQLPPNERFFSQVASVTGDWWQICACVVCVDYQNMLSAEQRRLYAALLPLAARRDPGGRWGDAGSGSVLIFGLFGSSGVGGREIGFL
ncbi:uncharacterized [Tachysurus ichikawai]